MASEQCREGPPLCMWLWVGLGIWVDVWEGVLDAGKAELSLQN